MRTANEFSSRTRSSSRVRRSSILSLYSDAAREVHHVNLPVEDEDIVIVIPEDTLTNTAELMVDQPAHVNQPASKSHHGHHDSHSHSMNMRALVLHILGDALGNIGVIATGLIIWLAKGGFRYYFDPMVSIVIALIICYSALPLGEFPRPFCHIYIHKCAVRSASFILLQGVPPTVSIDDVRSSILSIDGVQSLHDLHIWQLSESKVVASMHVMTSLEHDFMLVASNIRKVLHQQGIHSSTIQPEYHELQEEGTVSDESCLILCPQDQKCDPLEHSCCRVYPEFLVSCHYLILV
jgi:solute carrier family 30 (zinc transporter), member 1